jgi:hypothetical protein
MGGRIPPANQENLHETVDTQLFMEEPAETNTTEFKLLAKH